MIHSNKISPILNALTKAENICSVDIRVHVSYRWFESSSKAITTRGKKLFQELHIQKNKNHCGVLLYINLKQRRFTWVHDPALLQQLPQHYWNGLSHALTEDLLSTYWENAIAVAILTLGTSLSRYFPKEPPHAN